ncbi:pre-B-cell leukemia transcription factor-interacting protein 1 isoform X2 [Xenopus laevis]|uniref:Pre-B-cell leukemia transcription factor-interacting protein 1 isoform X2 n=1 Tax=Xenopus laevis TaxID=8355 RepID=A0A8J0TLT1_XENLA|nr:pre-B-cell leukemia transcription factor-interacting protein 1 isoform X2 [Xenopus laevis]XP_018087056.1 pre-B-cell leukemia transcription factor-interacting protein 1 isoform X2 [Xenopus laevis]
MSGAAESRDSENNWVITNNEGFPVETLGASQTATSQVQLEEESVACDTDTDQGATQTDGSAVSRGSEETPPQPAATLTNEEQLFIDPEVPEIPAPELEPLHPKPSSDVPRNVDEELEEVSCSSSEEDVEGLRKRAVRGAAPLNVAPSAARETPEQETDMTLSLTLNKCIISALALLALAFLLFSGSGMMTEEDPYESVQLRSVSGGETPAIVAIQEWVKQHAADFTGDPGNLQVMNSLLDKVAKENQEIRLVQATLQAQKEELEGMLNVSEGETTTAAPLHHDFKQENVRLKEALLKEETTHLSAQEELQALKEKVEAMEGSTEGKEALTLENTKLKAELDSSQNQIVGFLSQKETLVAESQMLRQELDKQRLLLTSIRTDLENLNTQLAEPEDEQQLPAKISDMSSRLALELQRSETWEKKYDEHAQKRKQQIKDERRDHGHKEWKKGEKLRRPETSLSNGEFTKHDHSSKHWRDQGKESQHEEWKRKKYEQQEDRREEKKYRPWEREQRDKERDPKQHQYETSERDWKEKHHQPHEETGGNFHPRKGQRDFKSQKQEEKNSQQKEQEDQAHGKDSHHRHHDHNKFWKKLSDHQYRIPEGCSGVEECARKDGMDLFNVELKPVQRKQLEDVLHSYLAKVELSKTLPELLPLLDGFFDGPVFSHHKIRFRDFVDDMEDFLEELARRETGDDDIVDDFERYVYTSFFGDAALSKKRLAAKDHKKNQPEAKNYPKPHDKTQERHIERPPKSAYPEGEAHAHHNRKYHKDKSHGERYQNDKYNAGKARHRENEQSNYPHGASSDEGQFHKHKPHYEKQVNPDYEYTHQDYQHGEEHGKKYGKEKYPQGDRQAWGQGKDYAHKHQHKQYNQPHYEKPREQAHLHPQSHKPWKEHGPPAPYYSKEEWSGHRYEDPTRSPKWTKDGQYHDKHHHKEKHQHHWKEEKKSDRER